MVTLKGVAYAIRVRELCTWTPTFVGDDSGSDEEGFMGRDDQEDANYVRKRMRNRRFNEVREAGEIFGSIFNERQSEIFNEFITDASLIDIPLDGVVLEKGIPNHRLILLKESEVDYGPTPYRFFHSWLEMEGFHNLVIHTWKNDGIVEANGLISFKKKLQNLKNTIREWVTSKKAEANKIKKDHRMRLSSIDAKIDQGRASVEDFTNRKDSIIFLGEIDHLETKDIAQKAKIKWAIEGDENTSFFHDMLKKKRRQLAIKGILNSWSISVKPRILAIYE
ncbi:hypothetical protein Tco_0898617 [Tanacetum coccineum]